MERYGGGPIVIHDYDPGWPVLFEQERERILEALSPVVLTIEHVGSTAVPGQAAKPIIDLLVGVRSLAEARTACVEPFETLGYVYIPQYETWLPEELFFRKGPPGPWTHHARVMEPSNPRWEELDPTPRSIWVGGPCDVLLGRWATHRDAEYEIAFAYPRLWNNEGLDQCRVVATNPVFGSGAGSTSPWFRPRIAPWTSGSKSGLLPPGRERRTTAVWSR